MSHILILGGDGYLGWPTAMYFSNKGYEVTVADNYFRRNACEELDTGMLYPIPSLIERARIWHEKTGKEIKVVIGDLSQAEIMRGLFNGNTEYNWCLKNKFTGIPETVVHYAEQPSAPYSLINYKYADVTLINNLRVTNNLMWALRDYSRDTHMIKVGTMGEYGTPNIDIEEGWLKIKHNGREDRVLYPKKPGSFYHLSKVHDSANIEFACRIWGLKCTDLNQGFVYGITTKEIELDFENLSTSFHYDSIFGTIINRFITQMAIQKPMSVYGNGTQKRAFLNIQDTINCVQIASDNPAKKGEFRVFNQFTEFSSLNEMANKIKLFADKNEIKTGIKHIKNPRIEEEDHYYNPKNTSLISLGLKPIIFDNEQISKIYKVVKKILIE